MNLKMIKNNADKKITIFLLGLILIGIVLRVFRNDQILWFFYDQGRDALIIWDLIYKGKLTLIGPVTGLPGVFLGPFYYYLIAPAYYVGGGDPAVAASFVSILATLGVIFIYLIGKEINKTAGIFAAILAVFSLNWIKNDRWLSNPAPLSFFAPLTIWMLYLTSKNPVRYALLTGLLLGINLQLEASGSFFTLISAIIWIVITKVFKNIKAILLGVSGFLITLLPQLLFDLRHDWLITKNLFTFIQTGSGGGEGSFLIPTWFWTIERAKFLFVTYMDKIEPNPGNISLGLIFLVIGMFIWKKELLKMKVIWLIGLWIIVPSLIIFFYRGNFGRVYTYYFNPVIPVVFLLVGTLMSLLWQKVWGKVMVVLFLGLFVFWQYKYGINYVMDGLDGETTVAFGNQKAAVEWVFNDAGGREFNTDVYVPPVIPYAYNYLFLWLGEKKYGYHPKNEMIENLYTIYEVDTESPKRLNAWLLRQDGIGNIVKTATFGGVKASKRERVKYE